MISRPGEDWEGETGHIRTELLDRVLPEDRTSRQYFLCASELVMEDLAVMCCNDVDGLILLKLQ